jgi:hypothetical protein
MNFSAFSAEFLGDLSPGAFAFEGNLKSQRLQRRAAEIAAEISGTPKVT